MQYYFYYCLSGIFHVVLSPTFEIGLKILKVKQFKQSYKPSNLPLFENLKFRHKLDKWQSSEFFFFVRDR